MRDFPIMFIFLLQPHCFNTFYIFLISLFSFVVDLLDDLMEDEDICDAEAPEDEEESEEEDIHVCGFCKEQFTDLDKFVKHKKSKICRYIIFYFYIYIYTTRNICSSQIKA